MQENQKKPLHAARRRWLRTLQRIIAPEWLRRHRARLFQIYVLITVGAFSALALLAELNPYLPIDLKLTLELQREIPAWLGVLLNWVNWPGFTPQSFIIIGTTLIGLSMMGLRWEGVAAVIAAFNAGALNYLVKIAIRRPRPAADLVEVLQILDSYSFPSGHVMFYTAFFGFLLFLAFTLLERAWRRLLVMLLPGILILLVGIARMYVGEHWASDVIAGYLLGSLVLVLSIMIYRWGKPRFFIDQPAAPPIEVKDKDEI